MVTTNHNIFIPLTTTNTVTPQSLLRSIPCHDRILDNRPKRLPTRIALVRPHHLPLTELVRPMPRNEVDSLIVILECFLHCLEQRVGLVLIDTHIIADGQDNLADFFLGAVGVMVLVFVEADGDVDAGFGGPSGVDGKPINYKSSQFQILI